MNRVLPQQTLLDVILQVSGTHEAIADFLRENPTFDFSANVQPGTPFEYSGVTVDRDVLDDFTRTSFFPVSVQSTIEFGEAGDYKDTYGNYYKDTYGNYYLDTY